MSGNAWISGAVPMWYDIRVYLLLQHAPMSRVCPISVSDILCTTTTGYDPTLRYTPTWGYTAISTHFANRIDSCYAPIRMGVHTDICIYSNIGEYPGFRGMPPSRDISRFHIWIYHDIWVCPRYPGIPRYQNIYINIGVYPHVGVCPHHQQGIP